MELTDDELSELFDVLYDNVYYGEAEIVYGNTLRGVARRSLLKKVEDEGKKRGIFKWK